MTEVIASPSVRALARKKGIDLDELARNLGRETIAREDLDGGGEGPAGPADASSYWDVDHSQYGPVTEEPMSRFAQIAARNLSAAATVIPAVTHHDSADISMLETFRRGLKDEAQARGVKLTALPFQVKALARCLREFPRFNASLSPDGKTLFLKGFVHVGVAVDTAQGLMVPVVRDADRKGVWAIAREIADLASRAQDRKLSPDDMGGASMTISSLGGIGGQAFTPIVNPPEVAILGVTRTQIAPRWNGEAFEPAPMLPLDLTYDHRVINGADAARFMVHFCGLLADPRRIMV
jgi:pyruvate dehydrogenase E2 component (dihydrolipoamide acetyltransferase)